MDIIIGNLIVILILLAVGIVVVAVTFRSRRRLLRWLDNKEDEDREALKRRLRYEIDAGNAKLAKMEAEDLEDATKNALTE